jgi:D-methionine transport system ATP-binding protein
VFRHPQQEVTKIFVQQDLEPKADPSELLKEFIKENPNGTYIAINDADIHWKITNYL